MEPLLITGIVLALLFNFVNGLNDAANSIATVVATRVLTPLQGVLLAAFFNMVGPLVFTTVVAKTIGKGIVSAEFMTTQVILFGLFSAVLWVVISSYSGIPISASHALVGGLIGSAIAFAGLGAILWPAAGTIIWLVVYAAIGAAAGAIIVGILGHLKGEENLLPVLALGSLCGIAIIIPFVTITRILPVSGILAILIFIVVSPVIGLLAAFLISIVVIRFFRNRNSKTMNFLFRKLQLLSAAFYSIGHGSNDAQNAMGVITAILVAGGLLSEFIVPFWVIIISGSAMALGTFLGGWRVVETMATKITKLRPYQGFCAETGGGIVLAFVTAFGIPVSTTHAISGSIMGVGASRGYSAVQWGVVRRIVAAWILTIPLTAVFAYVTFLFSSWIIG
ncbi:MAG: inorganic phosphate transporter [Methanomicrobiales archaeon]|nr:inorganic phosphate transporter [Methanomicrobiales archaeon]NYT20834.1 inorganic phosphate transporter [Methanomicrobiales archaeon]